MKVRCRVGTLSAKPSCALAPLPGAGAAPGLPRKSCVCTAMMLMRANCFVRADGLEEEEVDLLDTQRKSSFLCHVLLNIPVLSDSADPPVHQFMMLNELK